MSPAQTLPRFAAVYAPAEYDYEKQHETVWETATSQKAFSHHLQTRMADGNGIPPVLLVLVIVTGVGVAFRQIASP